ncbi:MAG TPA: ABC transporter substrate-binding protein [Candidatus Eisenbacteria bacterium]|nr:ABC transporter substrate-binding protein [Candidatus Eisenbacteria bacterium]
MMLRKILPASALLIFFVSSGFLPVAAQVDFPIGYVSRGGTYAFITLIEQHKLLEQEGIKPTFVYIGGPQVSQALISGDIRMAIVAAASPIRAAAHGADLRFVAGVTDKEVASFVTAANIKTPADLKGTRLAIDRLGDYSDFRARKVLEIFGLQAQKDVTLLQIGAQTARFAALRSGQVQSTFVVPPLTLVARKAGLRELADLGELGFPSSSGALVVMQSTIERQAREIYGVLRAVAKAIRIYKTDKEQGIGAIAQFMRLNDREALEETWRMNANVLKDNPSPPVAGIRVVRDFLAQTDPEVKKMNLESFITTQFTDRLQREGVK